MHAVEVEELTHSYGPRRALSGVSFHVEPAELFSLLGPNGGGKTTLFRILSTLFPATSGTAKIFGLDVRQEAARVRRELGVVFQNPSLDAKLTVRENLYHQGHLYGLSGRHLRSRVDAMLDRLKIKDRASSLVETLSGGLRRRVELAKGMLHGPRLLIMDEPSVGLDPGARHDLWRYLQDLRDEEGVTILSTTHLTDEADRSNHVLILNRGSVVGFGTPQALKSQIGGDVIVLTAENPARLSQEVTDRFEVETTVLNGSVRINKSNGHEFIPQLIESFPGLIHSVTLAKPTLEDVFIERTGHRLWEDG